MLIDVTAVAYSTYLDPSQIGPRASKTAKKKMVVLIGSLLSPKFL